MNSEERNREGQPRVGPLSLNTQARWPITRVVWKIDMEPNLVNREVEIEFESRTIIPTRSFV
jgi:hypothetical protein